MPDFNQILKKYYKGKKNYKPYEQQYQESIIIEKKQWPRSHTQ